MPSWLATAPIAAPWVLILCGFLALIAVVAAVVAARLRRRWSVLVGAAVGAVFGLGLAWLLTQPLDLFDVTLSPTSYTWGAAAFAGVGAVVVPLIRGHAAARVLAAVAIVLSLVAGAAGVNADFGQYTTVGSLFGAAAAGRSPASVARVQAAGAPGLAAVADHPAAKLWKSAERPGTPRHGLVYSVHIPATESHFAARTAYVYLPPVALTTGAPRLPLLMMLSGQPGGPQNIIQSGQLAAKMDAFAAAHHGFAPIVVVPDQLGAPQNNPMCLDSALGNSASYLTVDVPKWIKTHLAVEPQPAAWAIGGFSEGGTCSIQLGAAHPELFRSIFDISGQESPKNGTLAQTIARGFGGSDAGYKAAQPAAILAARAPYHGEVAVFGSGQLDARYGPEADAVAAAARSAGIAVTRIVSPGTAHDWHTVQWMLANGTAPIMRHVGLSR